jgi:hypothetical protein
MPGQQPDGSFPIGTRQTFQYSHFFADAYVMCFLPFLRYGMGKRGIGAAGFFALIIMLLYAGTTGSDDMLMYIKAWFIFAVYRRLRYDKRQHTNFPGWPLLTDWIIKSDRLALAAEAVLVYVIGTYLYDWSEPVGQFVAWGALPLALKCFIYFAAYERQKEGAHNAIVQMQITQSRLTDVRQRRD